MAISSVPEALVSPKNLSGCHRGGDADPRHHLSGAKQVSPELRAADDLFGDYDGITRLETRIQDALIP
jgi:hypothetical protein